MPTHQKLSSFVRFDEGESFDRDYYLSHTNKLRFRWRSILVLVALALLCLVLAIASVASFEVVPVMLFVTCAAIWLGVLSYLTFRRLKVSHGYAAVTSKRLIYYEFNDHPAENYQHIVTAHLDDLTGIVLRTDWSLFTKSFSMSVYTSQRAVHIGARGFLGILNLLGKQTILEPGPDAVQFIQDMTGLIAARKQSRKASAGSA